MTDEFDHERRLEGAVCEGKIVKMKREGACWRGSKRKRLAF
jgi:hypothetical protein